MLRRIEIQGYKSIQQANLSLSRINVLIGANGSGKSNFIGLFSLMNRLVNQFSPQDVIVVDRIQGASHFRRLTEQEITAWLEDYGLGDLWEKNLLGGRPAR